jgi:transposase
MATRAEWAKRVRGWQRSGLSIEEFAERKGIKPKQLAWWRWKLQGAPPAASEMRFLPVHVVEAASSPPGAEVPLEVALPNGRVVRVPPGFDPAMLESVLSIASGGV